VGGWKISNWKIICRKRKWKQKGKNEEEEREKKRTEKGPFGRPTERIPHLLEQPK